MVGVSIRFIVGIGLCLSKMFIAPPPGTELISNFYSVMKSYRNPPHLLHLFTLGILVHPHHPSLMIILIHMLSF